MILCHIFQEINNLQANHGEKNHAYLRPPKNIMHETPPPKKKKNCNGPSLTITCFKR